MKEIRWGIVGLGNIARKFATDLALVPNCTLQAVASSDKKRAHDFADEFNAKTHYSDYDRLFKDLKVDVVYIASLHPQHAELSLAALKEGKGVLCEKPLGLNAREVGSIITSAKENNAFLMEALWTRFNPAFEQVGKWIAQNQIGPLRYINASFSFNGLDRGEDSRLFNPDKAGGTLLDIGIYPLFLAYHLLGIPTSIKANATLTSKGVDEQLAFLLSFDKAHALMYSSFTHDEDMRATICGEEGEIYMDSRWHETPQIKLVQKGKESMKSFNFLGKGYTYEIEEVNHCLRNKLLESPKWTMKNSLEMASLMDEIRSQVGVSFPGEKTTSN